jgi:hypothetical protein
MSTPVYCESFSALLPEGIITPSGIRPWDADSGQAGPADVTRAQVLDKPYLSFGKLSLPDRLAFSAGSLVLSDCPITEKESAGICLGLPGGSLSTDLRYMESVIAGFPSPAVFSATLPSSAIADIAIFYGLKGENRVFAGGAESGLYALDCAVTLLSAGKATVMLVLSVNAIAEGDFSSPLLPRDFTRENRAYAFLLSAKGAPVHPGHRIEVSLKDMSGDEILPAHKDLPAGAGELYFYNLVKLLRSGTFGDGTVECDAPGVSGRISIVKDS